MNRTLEEKSFAVSFKDIDTIYTTFISIFYTYVNSDLTRYLWSGIVYTSSP